MDTRRDRMQELIGASYPVAVTFSSSDVNQSLAACISHFSITKSIILCQTYDLPWPSF
jgi:hypothetical protein